MEEGIYFKDSLTLKQYIMNEARMPLFVFLFLIFSALMLLILGVIFSYVFAVFAVFMFIMSLFPVVAILLNYYGARNNIILKNDRLILPPFDFANRALRAFDGEGYFYDSKYNDFAVASFYNNINRVWRVFDKNEQELLDINKNQFNTQAFSNIGIFEVNIKALADIIQNYKNNDKLLDNLIKKCFVHRYVSYPQKAVCIEFKELKFKYPKLLDWEGKTPLNSIKNVFWNDFKNVVVYVSVSEPDKLVKEIEDRIKNNLKI